MSEWGATTANKAFKFWPATATNSGPGLDKVGLDDRGFTYTHPNGFVEVIVASGMMFSNNQSTDSSVTPVLTIAVPASGNYVTGQELAFVINSNEVLSISGTPTLTITFGSGAGANATGTAYYQSGRSTTMQLVFVYSAILAADKRGALASIAYAAAGATITDVGGAAVSGGTLTTLASGATVTGIVLV